MSEALQRLLQTPVQQTLEPLLARLLHFNPAVAMLELRTRLRGERPYMALFLYAFVAAAVVAGIAIAGSFTQSHGLSGAVTGRVPLLVLCSLQLTLMFLMLPALGAGALALEREKGTLELLQTTQLSAVDIVGGKLLSNFAFAALLLTATLPVAAWCLVLGSVSPLQVLLAYAYLLVVALEITLLGLVVSASADRAVTAVIATYGLLYGSSVAMSVWRFTTQLRSLGLTGGGSTLGQEGALLLLTLVVLVTSGISYAVVRLWGQRARAREGRRVSLLKPLAVAVAAQAALIAGGLCALHTIARWPDQLLLVVQPYVALNLILGSGAALPTGGGTPPPLAIGWLMSMGCALLVALVLWLLAVTSFEHRCRRG